MICTLSVFGVYVITEDDQPSMKELHTNVVCQYASKWKQLGLKLGLERYDILNILEDHASISDNRSVNCCTAVLQKWLQITPLPTWGKLDVVTKTLTIATKGMYVALQ